MYRTPEIALGHGGGSYKRTESSRQRRHAGDDDDGDGSDVDKGEGQHGCYERTAIGDALSVFTR